MTMRKSVVRRLASWLAVLLLLAQWATASYACPRLAPADPAAIAMPEMPGCDGSMSRAMDPERPLLCKAHCEHGTQASQPAAADPPPAVPVLCAVLDWHAQAARMPPAVRAVVAHPSPPDPPGAPPIYLAFRVFRD